MQTLTTNLKSDHLDLGPSKNFNSCCVMAFDQKALQKQGVFTGNWVLFHVFIKGGCLMTLDRVELWFLCWTLDLRAFV